MNGLFLCFVLYPALTFSLTTLQVSFRRTYVREGRVERVCGVIYHCAEPERTVVKVEEPLEQWMVLEEGKLEIFYPQDRRAFRITGRTSGSLPFLEAFLMPLKDDYGLEGSGYSLSGHDVEGDTLITYWDPPEKLRKTLGKFILAYKGDKLIKTELRDPGGRTLARSIYCDHVPYSGAFLPTRISTVRFSPSDTTYEDLIYTEPKFDLPLPEEVLDFRIPEDVDVEEVRW
mgnify:FL=1